MDLLRAKSSPSSPETAGFDYFSQSFRAMRKHLTTMRNCTSENLKIPGSRLRRAPEE
jgi:hypothetical protein